MTTFNAPAFISMIESCEVAELNMFVAFNGIFWEAEKGHFIFVQNPAQHKLEDYIDADHNELVVVEIGGMATEGVYWKNGDFMSPYDADDMMKVIEKAIKTGALQAA